jgi:hypothetical protein
MSQIWDAFIANPFGWWLVVLIVLGVPLAAFASAPLQRRYDSTHHYGKRQR